MTELEIAVSHWRTAFVQARLSRHPTVWVAHFAGDEFLGAVSATRPDVYDATCFYLSTPFAFAGDVTDSFVFIDRARLLHITRMSIHGRGVQTTDWVLPYTIDDTGLPVFDVAVRQPSQVSFMWRLCEVLTHRRLTEPPTLGFSDAIAAAVHLADQL